MFTEATSDAGGGQNVAGFDSNDWLAYYNVTFPTTGSYLIEYRVSSLDNNCRLSADLNAGSVPLGALAVPNTGGWQHWTTVSHTVNVSAGTYNFGVFAATGRWNLNWLRISQAVGRPAPAMAAAGSPALELYPNPVTNQLLLHWAQSLEGNQFQILDIMGRAVAAGPAAGSIDVSQLKAGIYTLRLLFKGRVQATKRFVK